MATEKEEIILEFKVDQNDLVSEMEKQRKLIIQNKQEQIELNKAFKAGKISADEYSREIVRVENNLKRQQKTYSDAQKSVLGHKSKIDELIKSNNNLAKTNQSLGTSFKEAASNINVAGVNVGSLTTKLASFANPATAAVGIATALGAAYARSTIGAKDLEFAQNELNTAITIGTNKFASLISSTKDGEGAVTKITDVLIGAIFGFDTLISSKLNALNLEKLQDLGRDELEIRDKINQRLDDNQELLTQLQSEQTNYNDKIGLTNQIISNLRTNESELTDILKEELSIIEDQLKLDTENENIQTSLLQKKKEISQVERDTEKRVQAILRMEQNLSEAESKRISELRELERINKRIAGAPSNQNQILQQRNQVRFGVSASDSTGITANSEQSRLLEREKIFQNARVALTDQAVQRQIEIEQRYTDFIFAEQQARLTSLANVFGAASAIFKQGTDEQKGLALFQIALDSGVGVANAIKAGSGLVWPENLVAIASGITAVLTGIGQARSLLGFAEGGYTGPGDKYQPAGIVHKDEYVVPKHIVHNPIYSGHITALEKARLGGYYDGGIVAHSAANEVNQQLATINAIKSMPVPEVSVKEVTKVQNKIRIKEQISNR